MTGRKQATQTQVVHMDGYDVDVLRKPVRNINLRIRADGTVVVSAPRRVPLYEIRRFLCEREAWIAARRAGIAQHALRRRLLTDGEHLDLFGTGLTVRLAVDAGPNDEHASRAGDVLTLHVTKDHSDDSEMALRQRSVIADRWLVGRLDREVQTLLGDCEHRVGACCSGIRYRRMVSRWGSCNVETKRITLNIELAERPRICLESVLCHELCHLHERGHNQRFYAYLDAACPTWREARRLLNERPPQR